MCYSANTGHQGRLILAGLCWCSLDLHQIYKYNTPRIISPITPANEEALLTLRQEPRSEDRGVTNQQVHYGLLWRKRKQITKNLSVTEDTCGETCFAQAHLLYEEAAVLHNLAVRTAHVSGIPNLMSYQQ